MIVFVVLILWVFVITVFVRKWGKLTIPEPYQPPYNVESESIFRRASSLRRPKSIKRTGNKKLIKAQTVGAVVIHPPASPTGTEYKDAWTITNLDSPKSVTSENRYKKKLLNRNNSF